MTFLKFFAPAMVFVYLFLGSIDDEVDPTLPVQRNLIMKAQTWALIWIAVILLEAL